MAGTLRTIYAFKDFADGVYPGGLVVGTGGEIFGTTQLGGAYDNGTAFRLTPPVSKGGTWTHSVIYTFGFALFDPVDGNSPGTLVLGTDGALYGTTVYGGTSTRCTVVGGCGTAFVLTPPVTDGGKWTHTVIYTFGTDAADGQYPGDVLLMPHGHLFGVTGGGGAHGGGTVFELTPPTAAGSGWTEKVLHSFGNPAYSSGPDGLFPSGRLLRLRQGQLVGTTGFGGKHGTGTVYELLPPGLAGPSWTERVLHHFGLLNGDGENPLGGLVLDRLGHLYGTTSSGGVSAVFGTVFTIVPPSSTGGTWTEQVIFAFPGINPGGPTYGYGPVGPLWVDLAGDLYGTTVGNGIYGQGGRIGGFGTLFKLQHPTAGGVWTRSVDLSFGAPGMSVFPYSNLVQGLDGTLFGTTEGYVQPDYGAVFSYERE